ncbi:serine hydrolase [Sphingomonas daechungensis]|uniref:serine hydrolase n=1 Tax=Sphingomonas daechungensis TaxID=1176646 RepID=UPI003783AF5F
MTSHWLSLGLAIVALGQSGSSTIAQATPAAALPAPRAVPAASAHAPKYLADRIDDLGKGFNGRVGIAVRSVDEGWSTSYNGNELNPQQSVSKLWVAITALDAVDRSRVSLNDTVTMSRTDLTLFHQPIAAKILGGGTTVSLGDLMFQALTKSDNTCNDKLMRSVGGPEAVRAMLRAKGLEGIRFYDGERSLQSRIAGLTWSPSYSIGNAFYEARNALPMSIRKAAFNRYVDDPYDGASANGITFALAKLKRGELLSPPSTARLLRIMSQTSTGPNRLKGGLKPGWSLSHKTGTGQILGAYQAGYNDIGILTAPDGRSYSVAVMIKKTSVPLQVRMTLMNNVVRATITQHEMRFSPVASL